MNRTVKTALGLVLGFTALFASMAPAQAQGGPSTVFVDPVIDEPLTQTSPVLGRLVARQRGVVAALTRGPVSEVTVAGNLIEIFARLVPGSDLEFRGAVNAPSVCVDAISVGGL